MSMPSSSSTPVAEGSLGSSSSGSMSTVSPAAIERSARRSRTAQVLSSVTHTDTPPMRSSSRA